MWNLTHRRNVQRSLGVLWAFAWVAVTIVGLPQGMIVYQRGSSFMIVTPDGSPLYAIMDVRGSHPKWSPDGKWIAYSRKLENWPHAIFVMSADGTTRTNLTNHPSENTMPSWSPDGKSIVFMSDRNGTYRKDDIFIMDADGGNVRQLTFHPRRDADPDWSPDGTQIVFATNRDEDPNEAIADLVPIRELYTMNAADGGNVRRLTFSPTKIVLFKRYGQVHQSPRWSPDGQRIVYTSSRHRDGWGIYSIAADGSGDRRLTDYPRLDQFPCWSPDGTQIAFQRYMWDEQTRSEDFEIFVMNADGSDPRNLTNNPASYDLYPDWIDPGVPTAVSPQGKRPFTWGWLKRLGIGR